MPKAKNHQYLRTVALFTTLKIAVFTLLPAIAFASGTYSGGTGDPNSPFQIAEPNDLIEMSQHSEDWDKHFILTNDINMNLADPNTFTTALIAPDTSSSSGFQGTAFSGSFNGQSYSIHNLTIDTTGASNWYLGLFGQLDSGATIQNLGLENVQITGGSCYLGSLVGYNQYGNIINCYATGSVTGGDYLGGLVGYTSQGTITNCYATCSVICGDYSQNLGGLMGNNYDGSITNCYATGSVTGRGYLGGLVGHNSKGGITNCYATGSVTGSVIDGISSRFIGGLVGSNNSGPITNCYFYLLGGPDNNLGTALDNVQIQDAASFVGFDFVNDWAVVSDHCPKLIWQTDDGPLTPNPPVTTLSGSGYSYDPFQINSYADFTEFRTNSSLNCGYYILTFDIDLSSETFTTAVIIRYFGGHFQGNNHFISNITIDTAGENNDYLGLFSITSGSLSNLGLKNTQITGGTGSGCLGSLVAYNFGEISNCYAIGPVTGSGSLGGLVGINRGAISNCSATGSVTGGYNSWRLGGLVGANYSGTISNCSSTGSVTGGDASDYLGGLVGNNDYGNITNCSATGSVTGGDNSEYLGGLMGYTSQGTISNCYATDSVTGGDDSKTLGGLVGRNDYGTISNCSATGNVTGGDFLGGLVGAHSTGTISDCSATGSVTGGDASDCLGGLVGANYSGTISNCSATGSVTGNNYLGGLVGSHSTGTISDCYSTGSVTGLRDFSWRFGGLVGINSEGNITNCYATGLVTGGAGLNVFAGLCGYHYGRSAEIKNCFWDTESSGMSIGYNLARDNPGKITNVLGKTTAEMQTQTTFTDYGWDFVGETDNGTADLWRMGFMSPGYPILSYQRDIPGDFTGAYGVDLADYSFIANFWARTDCDSSNNHCFGADLDLSGDIALPDLMLQLSYWLDGK